MNYFPFIIIMMLLGNIDKALAFSADSTAYEQQRVRVNRLLDERRSKFGDFDASLKARTGIFGLKTKKDMQASIDILKQIVLTDNAIFKETKALLDFKDIEKQAISSQATESGERISGYIHTINKLQTNQDMLQQELKIVKKQKSLYLYLFLLCLVGLVIMLLQRFRRAKN